MSGACYGSQRTDKRAAQLKRLSMEISVPRQGHKINQTLILCKTPFSPRSHIKEALKVPLVLVSLFFLERKGSSASGRGIASATYCQASMQLSRDKASVPLS